MIQLLFKFLNKRKEISRIKNITNKVYVTIDWAGNPITTKGDGYILPRRAEMIFNKQYYPTGKIGEWPCDPISGEKLPIKPSYTIS
jgi:hypothetical protein